MAKKRATQQPEEATGEQQTGVNKTKAVREYMKAHPKAKPIQVSEALGQQGIIVTPGYVSGIKTQMKKRRRVRRQAVKEVVEKRGIGVAEIKAALGLLKLCGSLPEAKEALAAAEEIRKSV